MTGLSGLQDRINRVSRNDNPVEPSAQSEGIATEKLPAVTTLRLPAVSRGPETVVAAVWSTHAHVPCVILNYDCDARTISVRTGDMPRVELHAVCALSSERAYFRSGFEAYRPFVGIALGEGAFLPRGQTLPFALMECEDEARGPGHVTAWFSASTDCGRLDVRGSGRFVDVAIERPFLSAEIAVEGPPGFGPLTVAMGVQAHSRVFVADTTRFVHVTLNPGGMFTFPSGPESIVVR